MPNKVARGSYLVRIRDLPFVMTYDGRRPVGGVGE
jgi:hypothetical protein